MRIPVCVIGCLIALPAHCGAARNAAADKSAADKGPVYELRTYTTAAGRLPALHKRFRDHTMRIFARHGMKNVLYFTPDDQPNTLVYLLRHASRGAADKSWAAFRKDPEWQRVFKASRKDGKIVTGVKRTFLKLTDYSPGRRTKTPGK